MEAVQTKKERKPMNPIWFLVIGICILIIPTAIYLGFLIPKMSEEYIILMSSAGVVGGSGMFGTEMIPEKVKFGALFKTASKAFTALVCLTLVQDFLPAILGLLAVFAVSFIIFKIMRSLYKDGKQKRANADLAKEVARGITEGTK